MSQNINQIYEANPITSNASTDLMYFGQSPYTTGDDAAETFADFAAQFGAPYTASALTKTNDTNVTLTLGGTPSTALLEATSLTLGWTGTLSGARGGTGVANTGSTFTMGGDVAFSGAYTFAGTLSGNTAITFPTSGTLLTSAGAVTSIAGTANEITASASTGAVTLSIPNNPILPGTGGVQIPGGNTAARAGNAGTMRFNSQSGVFEGTVDGSTWATFESSSTGVISVSGTVNQIDVTPTTGLCVVSIDPSYAGQTSITTLGTIATGVWNGSLIPLAYGGTNADLTASNGGIFYSTASAGAILAGTSTASQVLLSGASTTPAWSTAVYPASTTVNQLLYSSSANVIAGLATADNGVLITSAAGVPSVLANGTTGQVLTATTGSPPSWANGTTTGTGWVLISTQAASSSASLVWTSGITASYNNYVLVFSGVVPGTSDASLELQISTNGGSSYLNSNYSSGANVYTYSSPSGQNGNTSSAFLLTAGQSTNQCASGVFFLQNMTAGTVSGPMVNGQAFYPSLITGGGEFSMSSAGGIYNSGTPVVNAIKVLMSSGNIASGTFSLYYISQ